VDFHSLLFVFLAAMFVISGFAAIASARKRAFRLTAWSAAIAIVVVVVFELVLRFEDAAEALTIVLLPTLVAAAIIKATMGRWGLAGLAIVLALSAVALICVVPAFGVEFVDAYRMGWLPWSITSFWSTVVACYFLAMYLALYAAFLQPYLGDAARYFRNSPGNVMVRREIRQQAVSTLEALHLSGDYDRVIVVAHSLGTVVAYDMLRAYYSRVNGAFPAAATLGPVFDEVDRGELTKAQARQKGREIIAKMAHAVEDERERQRAGDAIKTKAWLVTDFVTLGSPLTHAHYLMCQGTTEAELRSNFDRRTREREFPTCPPRKLDGDGRLSFTNPHDQQRYFHHGGQFALTRWTNIFFPISQLLWGDAIGGEVGPVFRDPEAGSNIADVPVHTAESNADSFFAHVLYWDTAFGENAPHIEALRKAIDLADTGAANDLA
jgi:hypothetical protein